MNVDVAGFDYVPRTRLIYGAGVLNQLGTVAREIAGNAKVLLVTDQGIVQAGHAARAQSVLEAAGLGVVVYDKVRENPDTRDVDACLQVAKAAQPTLLIGLGGGSSMDVAKGTNFLYTNGGRMQDYRGVGKAAQPMLPLICVPTTAGTGSECQSFALIADETTHQKMACGDPKTAARVALLDPELTVSQPPRVTACTGIDALSHAVETAVTKKRSEFSAVFSREACAWIVESLPVVLKEPQNLRARGHMQLAAAFAGTAIESSMLGAAHACANPLTANFGIVHGLAVGLMLPTVVRFNAHDAVAREHYLDLAATAGLCRRNEDPRAAVEALATRIEFLLNAAGIPRSLSELGVNKTHLAKLSDEASKQWTGTFNPRALGPADCASLYATALEIRGDGWGGGERRRGSLRLEKGELS